MEWGIINRQEVHAMIEERRIEDRRKIAAEIAACNARHDVHDKEREADRKVHAVHNEAITKLTEALTKTNDTLNRYLPNLADAEEKRATKHQLKEGALLVSAILGAVLTTGTVIIAAIAYFNGYFIK